MRAYPNCKFCRGRGCLACEGEAEKAYNKQFPNGPQPIATISPEGMNEGDVSALFHRLLTVPSQEAEDKIEKAMASPVGKIVQQLTDDQNAREMFRRNAIHDTITENCILEQNQQEENGV